MKKLIALLATIALGSAVAAAPAPTPAPPIGIEAWSEHVAIARDAASGYRALARYGLPLVELYGIDGDGWDALPALLAANHLQAVAAHASVDALAEHPEEMARRARRLGARYVGVAWLKSADAPQGGLTVADADRAAAAFKHACPVLRRAGLIPFLHLHGYEFVRDPGGAGTMLDRLLSMVPAPCMAIEIDVYWVAHAGQDPIALLRKLGRRVALLHLKQPVAGMPIDDSGSVAPGFETALDDGPVDWRALLAEAKRQGVSYAFIEDETGEPGINVPRSVTYLRRIGVLR